MTIVPLRQKSMLTHLPPLITTCRFIFVLSTACCSTELDANNTAQIFHGSGFVFVSGSERLDPYCQASFTSVSLPKMRFRVSTSYKDKQFFFLLKESSKSRFKYLCLKKKYCLPTEENKCILLLFLCTVFNNFCHYKL